MTIKNIALKPNPTAQLVHEEMELACKRYAEINWSFYAATFVCSAVKK